MAKILLVEDDNNLREIYGARLGAEGYQIVSAGDGEEALAVAVKEKPDLIISDVMMPKVSGFDMLDILRNAPETKDTKIIMMTALSQAEDKDRANKLGADLYLVKSQVTLEDVVASAKKMLSDSSADTSTETTPSAPAPTAVNPAPTPPAPEPTPPAIPEPTAPAPVAVATPPAESPTVAPAAPTPAPAPAPVAVAPVTPAPEPPAPAAPPADETVAQTPTTPTLSGQPAAPAAPTPAPAATTPPAVPAPTPTPTPPAPTVPKKIEVVLPDTEEAKPTETPAATPTVSPPAETEEKPTDSIGPTLAQALADEEQSATSKVESSDSKPSPTPSTTTVQPAVPDTGEDEPTNADVPVVGSPHEEISGKKVIQPINDPTKGPDLDALLAKEEAREITTQPPSEPTEDKDHPDELSKISL